MRIIHFATEGVFDKAVTLELCRPLLKSVLDVFGVTNLRTKGGAESSYNASKTRSWKHPESEALGSHQHPEMFINPSLLAECLARCIQLNWDDLSMRFSLKIVAKIAEVPPVEFRHLWIPFVRELISTLDPANVPLSTLRYQELARAILEAYLDKQVGMEPSGAADYSGQGPVHCSCSDCWSLDRFLESGERVWRFSAVKKRREHVESQLTYSEFSCSRKTESWGSPYTLVVTKDVDCGAKAKKEWSDRFAQAWHEFSKFDQGKLKVLLGADWEKITTMRQLRFNQVPEVHVQRVPPPPPAVLEPRVDTGNAMWPANLVAGVKRRADD